MALGRVQRKDGISSCSGKDTKKTHAAGLIANKLDEGAEDTKLQLGMQSGRGGNCEDDSELIEGAWRQ